MEIRLTLEATKHIDVPHREIVRPGESENNTLPAWTRKRTPPKEKLYGLASGKSETVLPRRQHGGVSPSIARLRSPANGGSEIALPLSRDRKDRRCITKSHCPANSEEIVPPWRLQTRTHPLTRSQSPASGKFEVLLPRHGGASPKMAAKTLCPNLHDFNAVKIWIS